MSDIIETYQEEQKIQPPKLAQIAFAKVVSVSADGVKVRFDGESTDSTKYFLRNQSVTFSTGQRVLMLKVNGEYIVICPVGK